MARKARKRKGPASRKGRKLTELDRREANYKKFDAARTAIAKRLGISPGHAQAHYERLVEHDGLSPEKAAEATWGWQD